MTRRQIRLNIFSSIAIIVAIISFTDIPNARAEYGDVVLNNFSSSAGIRPVIFPHWFHRIRFSCKSCHSDLGFQMKAGANKIDMLKIVNGEYCGACHNAQIAWSVENCDLCHSAKKNTPTQVVKEHTIKLRTGK
jgi:c(7)-type cytochrome triheme protein